ncbi:MULTISPECIES: hypothetical protein [Sphingomonas]|jgi:hypothetical protein|uniref:Uncharacterized protein n=1 Tax=Sphingomonas leidyi TaxID=68569 RepID=A0A7X5ZUP2_9SPHN|nr:MULTISPECIES: hypothetical protein [Sphingomonas]MBN8813353.1 hypothetical protein [Sphingomonas sp.]NIJ63613.1 hypothetical protein [Sphingomonas leidyi]
MTTLSGAVGKKSADRETGNKKGGSRPPLAVVVRAGQHGLTRGRSTAGPDERSSERADFVTAAVTEHQAEKREHS